ncbi:integrase catalytic domain-containing protein [Trichonephila clavipes]|nr:integrase catalytic domain-containing protein [Trichonephila clavipes]
MIYFDPKDLLKFMSRRGESKRFILSVVGRIFDPIGILGPFVIKLKCLLQELWTLGVEWDSELPPKLRHKWQQWSSEAEGLTEIKIPRFYLGNIDQEISKCEIHCFSDASKSAYGTILYFRFVTCNNKIETSFICSKSPVAPLKSLTLPRLELTAALLSASAKPADQLSGQLPRDRITQSPPFQIVGIDFTGAILVKDNQGTRKSYVSLFTCAVTRAVHLELVSDMSIKCFLLALRRFLARRGNCKVIYSDNARTFKAAERELAYFANILKDSEFQNFVADKGIHWKFIVERVPWWGGFYERLVKTIKDPLRKILGRALLTFEELSTILSEVEIIINHRPLTYVENDPGEPEPLTPAHFLELGYSDSKYPRHFIELIDTTTAKERLNELFF